MRKRARGGRRPNDDERKAAIDAAAERFAAEGDFAAMRATLRRLKEIELHKNFAITGHQRRPTHPMYDRQCVLRMNARKRKFGMEAYVQPVPPHPTKAEQAAFARRIGR